METTIITNSLIRQAAELRDAGRITFADFRDIASELEGNAAAIPGVQAFLASV